MTKKGDYNKIVRQLRSAIGIAFSIFMLWLLIKQSGLRFIDLTLNSIGWVYFMGAIVTFITTIYLQSLRVKILWLPTRNVDTYSGLLCGNFYNSVLPGNIGEAVRALHLSRKNKVPILLSICSQLVEKYIDAFTFVIVSLIWFTLYGYTPHFINTVIILTSILSLTICLIGILLFQRPLLYKKLLKKFPLPFALKRIAIKGHSHFTSLIHSLFIKRKFILYFFLGFVLFNMNSFQYFLVMKSIHLPEALVSLKNCYFLSLCMVIIAFVPAAPGNTGIAHYGIYTAIQLLASSDSIPDIKLQQLAAFSFFNHLSFFLPEIFLGLICVVRERRFIF